MSSKKKTQEKIIFAYSVWLPNKTCLFYSNANVIYLQLNPNNEILSYNSNVQTPKTGNCRETDI